MKPNIAMVAAALALAACNRDAATAPKKTLQGPSMATVADSGGGSGPSHFVANGDFASVNWFSGAPGDSGGGGGGGFVFGNLSVSRGGLVTKPQALLSYFIEQCDPFFFCNFFEGFGTIPTADVSGGGGKQLHLGTNTSGNPNFFTFGGPAGLITVDWLANGVVATRSSGTFDQTLGTFRQHTTGVSTSVSANTSGNVVGIPIPPLSQGNIGTNQNVTIDIQH